MKSNKWFSNELSLDEGKSLYRKLLKENHPDVGGDSDICAEIIKAFESFCKYKMQFAFNESGDEKTGNCNATAFADILAKVIHFNCKIEIIGFWIYAFQSYEYRTDLANLGFFFSSKHKAWIFNGESKKRIYSKNTLQDNKNHYGCTTVRVKEELTKIA